MFLRYGFLLFLTAVCALAVPETHEITKRSSPPPTDVTFINTVLTTVNGIRSKHAAAAVTWDATLASFALQKSNGCKLNHVVGARRLWDN